VVTVTHFPLPVPLLPVASAVLPRLAALPMKASPSQQTASALSPHGLPHFCAVMKPVATAALDILQAEKNCYLGLLLPTLICLRIRVQNAKETANFAVPLANANAVLNGFEVRFRGCFRDELILAAATLPQFRLRWCGDDQTKEMARNMLRHEMTSSRVTDDPADRQSSDETDDEFFAFTSLAPARNDVNQELDLYLSDDCKQLDSLNRFPAVKLLFLKYNTGIPSSAPVERLFSARGQIMTSRRSRLSDEHFEMLLLLKLNETFK